MDIPESSNFVQDIIVNDLATGKRKNVHTRFPLNRTATSTSDTPSLSA